MDDPFDPDEFGDLFAEALESLCDDGTEIDLSLGGHTAELSITVGSIDYLVRISPVGLPADDS